MALRFIDLLESRTGQQFGPDGWLPASRLLFIESHSAEVLRRELWRYLREEVAGRSFLIAGYRGAGKTTMVRRAVADVADAVLLAAVFDGDASVAQRPLLVKLHGPSLFSGSGMEGGSNPDQPPAFTVASVTTPTATVTSFAPAAAGVKKVDNPDPDDPKNEPIQGSKTEPTQGAIKQITTGLYRALATEVVRSFRIHAVAAGSGPGDKTQRPGELAAQLRLHLDTGPSADMLRAYWRRLGRLGSGVIWPAGTTVRPDQGAREIIALATAAQVFQVCIGAISYEQSRKDAGGREERIEAKAALSPAQLLAPLAGLVGGAGLGLSLAAAGVQTEAAAAAGMGGGLLAAVTLAATATRSRQRDETADYKFIRDFSITTLDRDLPEVIQRIREAGLAPVFLVDELDKVDNAQARLGELIDRLKNLTTDYGFFCFLTHRAYYEHLFGKTRLGSFPKEFTYFSNLLVLGYSASETLRYLLRAVRPESSSSKVDAAAWIVFAFAARHRSRLNGVALARELARAFDETGVMREQAVRSAGRPRAQLEAVIQLAIDLVAEDAAEPFDADLLFPQWIVDALYCLSSAWNGDSESVDLSPEAIRAYLLRRSDTPEVRSAKGKARADRRVSDRRLERELGILSGIAIRVASRLENFRELGEAAKAYVSPDRLAAMIQSTPSDSRYPGSFLTEASAQLVAVTIGLAQLAPPGAQGLVKRVAGSSRFEFQINWHGGAKATPAKAQTVARLGQADAIRPLHAFAIAMLEALRRLEVTVDDLCAAGLLPTAASDVTVGDLVGRVAEALNSPFVELGLEPEDFIRLQNFCNLCQGYAATMTWGIMLARTLSSCMGVRSVAAVLPVLSRNIDVEDITRSFSAGTLLSDLMSRQVSGVPDLPLPPPFVTVPDSVSSWADAIVKTTSAQRSVPVRPSDAAWAAWRSRVADHLIKRTAQPAPVDFDDLIDAVNGRWPGALLRRLLEQVTAAEWSRLVIGATPSGLRAPLRDEAIMTQPSAPPWAFVAGLRALHFPARILRAAVEQWATDAGDLIEGAKDAAPADRSILWIGLGDAASLAAENADGRNTSILVMAQDSSIRPLVEWLRQNGALTKVVFEQGN